MKNRNSFRRAERERGFTLTEMLVSVGVLGLLGTVFFQVLQSGLVLSAKNTAVNVAHEETRQGILRLTRDIHASISVPQLRDPTFAVVNPVPVSGVAPTAAGVSFQNIASGPDFVWKDQINSSSTNSLIMIKDNPTKPTPGMRLIIPFFNFEEDITKVAAAGTRGHSNVFVKADQSTPKITAPNIGSPYAVTYYTDRVMYLVKDGTYVKDDEQGSYMEDVKKSGSFILAPSGTPPGKLYRYENGELHLYKQRYNGSALYWQDVAIIARYISSPEPFYVPLNRGGSPNTKYVGVKLTARDPKSTNRGYLATASLIDTQIDYRSRLTFYQ